jgi:hypothetical protein
MQHYLARAAARGLTGAPQIPDVAKPPIGFAVTRNSGAYDADGNLLRQYVQTKRDSGDVYEVPTGHVVKGESALLDPQGQVLARWIKTREGSGEGLVEALKAAFAAYDGKAPPIPAPSYTDDEILTIYPLPDLHFGMLAWGRETGDDWDIEIACKTVIDAVSVLVSQSRPSSKAVVLGLGDLFHSNDARAVTPESGHKLDVDGRWAKVFAAGARLAVDIVSIVARKHAEVSVAFLPGNHDPDAAMSLTVALSLFYARTPGITVHQEPGAFWYLRFGKCLLGATHGHSMKPERMAMVLATDRAKDWGETEYRHMFFGHVHHERAIEVGTVRIESFSTPAAKDAWTAAGGYRSGRAMSAITFHKDRGEIGRHRINISARAA